MKKGPFVEERGQPSDLAHRQSHPVPFSCSLQWYLLSCEHLPITLSWG